MKFVARRVFEEDAEYKAYDKRLKYGCLTGLWFGFMLGVTAGIIIVVVTR